MANDSESTSVTSETTTTSPPGDVSSVGWHREESRIEAAKRKLYIVPDDGLRPAVYDPMDEEPSDAITLRVVPVPGQRGFMGAAMQGRTCIALNSGPSIYSTFDKLLESIGPTLEEITRAVTND